MSTQRYKCYQDIHAADLPFWEGHGIGDGYCPDNIDDRSASHYFDAYTPDPNLEAEYTPYSYYSWRYPIPEMDRRKRPRDPDGKWSLNMTDYRRGEQTMHASLVSVPRLGNYLSRWVTRQVWHPSGPPLYQCQEWCEGQHALQADCSYWSEVGDYDYWHLGRGYPLIYLSNIDRSLVAQAIIDTRSQACLESIGDWDGLTDVVQLPGMLDEFGSTTKSVVGTFNRFINRHPASDLRIASRIPPIKLLKHASRALRVIGKSWLAYRYTYGTTIMSYKDIMKVLSESIDKKSKAHKTIKSYMCRPDSIPPRRIEVDVNEAIRVRSTVVSRYRSTSEARLQAMTVNPFVTAWELIPLSFVADWFINVGDFIASHFSSDRAVSSVACTAIKTSSTSTFTLVSPAEHMYPPPTLGGWSSRGNCETAQPQPDAGVRTTLPTRGLLSIVVKNAYDRTSFSCGSTNNLQYNPNLNWKRTLDGAALTLNVLRRLKSAFH